MKNSKDFVKEVEDDTHWERTLYEGVLCCSAKSLTYWFVKSLNWIKKWNLYQANQSNILDLPYHYISIWMQQSMQSICEKQTVTIPGFYKSFKMNIAWILKKTKNVQGIILSSINSNERKIFLDTLGGTGNTFLINLLLAKLRFDKKKLPLPWLCPA